MWDICTCVGKSRKSGLKVCLSRMCLVVICTRCTTSHLQYFLFLSSSCLHVCTGDDLLRACSYCSMQEGRNAFLLCAAGGHLAVAEYLAPKMKGHLFDGNNVGATALHLAASFGHLSMVEYLVKSCGFDVKAIEKVGLHCLLLFWCILWPLWTQLLLHGQLLFWHVYMYQLMWYTTSIYVSPIRFHVSPSLHVQSGTTPLLRAAQEGHTDIARILLGNGSNVTEQNKVGWPKGVWLPVII